MTARLTSAFVVTVGTRIYLLRGTDANHAIERLEARLGRVLPRDRIRCRPAYADDLELADLIAAEDHDRDELDRWRALVRATDTERRAIGGGVS